MRFLLFLSTYLLAIAVFGQTSFTEQLARHRDTYKKDLLASGGGPIKLEEDLTYVQFYAPNSTYRVEATVELTPRAEPFEMPTYSGATRTHVSYAVLSFVLRGKPQKLTLYRNLNLIRRPEYRDYLFLPFKDATSGEASYGGGRYMDLRIGDIKNGTLTLDFNKAYNPYCAYSEGYPCPIPPKTNTLSVAVEAGEKAYGKTH
ncbi:DUF1684 domain-containing protein [Spirosoma endophyticum]|uniref:DUF1684 domain-containing protein n=1 Tax=Spirosoma endophyticum TaxID=662367 RepID=A0A1I1RNK6_9BACT|nr:DUF1684 domain-containing protein [Spirosoma endophyticum]SFD35929.1 hypothetical protein SAMN05216167_104481 [Spirosoma endophyticum]